MKFEVCAACQNNCKLCAHGEMRRYFKGYQLSLEQLERFIYFTQRSGYFIENLRIHGIGEPLLWKHLNIGLSMLRHSGVIGTIFIATNGLALDRISKESWDYIDDMRVSVYSNYSGKSELDDLVKKYGEKIRVEQLQPFLEIPKREGKEGAPVPCKCGCPGPMFVGKYVFLFCGPPVYGAASLQGVNVFDCPEYYENIGFNYLRRYDEKLIGKLALCRNCWANTNFKRRKVENDVNGGCWE